MKKQKWSCTMFHRTVLMFVIAILSWGNVNAGTAGLAGVWDFSGNGDFYDSAGTSSWTATESVTGTFDFDSGVVSLNSFQFDSPLWINGALDDLGDGTYRAYFPDFIFVGGAPGAWEISEFAFGAADLITTPVGDAVVPSNMVIGAPSDTFIGFNLSGSLVVTVVPIPPAIWLFGSGLIGLIGFARHKQSV